MTDSSDTRWWERAREDTVLEDPVMVVARELTTLTLDGPGGPVAVRYGKLESYHSTAPDRFSCRYRGQDLHDGSLEGLRTQLVELEEAHEAKRQREAARKEAAKEPVEATHADSLADIWVRGVDKRSGAVLLLDAEGRKTSVPPQLVLRRLTDSDRADLVALQRRVDRAAAAAKAVQAPTAGEVLEGVRVDLRVRLDAATGERVADYGGSLLRGADDEDLCRQVYRLLLEPEFTLAEDGSPLGEQDQLTSYTRVYRTAQEIAEEKEAARRLGSAREELAAAQADLRLDLSLLSDGT